eukprot:gb/GEZN01036290.1/.p1 GENE.gb/GEZN01036290.1/~~gb/GEZN01036290.1/.p1  ORF type:complete len:115 (-),score=6.02 gb/GEZN01036290.1/:26-370(-)
MATTVKQDLVNDEGDLTCAFYEADKMKAERPLYIRPPVGADNPGILWKPKKGWPGLKDSMNGYWFRRARPFVLSQGFKPHPVFKCTFFRKCPKTNKTESIVIWVDNFNSSFSSK